MKKGILVVSFGTSYMDALKNSIENIENKIKESFKDYEIKRAFTSHKIIKKIKNRDNIHINTPEEALEEMKKEGYEEIIVQPLHIIPGEEYDYVLKVVNSFKEDFKYIEVGRPVFFYEGIEELPKDYHIFIDSIESILPKEGGTVLFGHGTAHSANAVYGCIQCVLQDRDYDNVFVGTVEGYPGFNEVLKRIKKQNLKEVTLIPLMVVCGDHAINDMASDEEDSWKSMLEAEGIKVKTYLHGLGEISAFGDIYVNHIKDVMDGTIMSYGKTKKGGK
ncbi:sirohydrochlorin cobaltochelatase [Clostridium sp.]|uniref:sirohydrochlorin cobaltochelatase n=1 Tax=Clostridium sp. TaxID=1506 RepID=UPI0034644FCE